MDDSKVQRLEDEIIELRYQLNKSRDKEMIYLDILSNIDTSLKHLQNEQEENDRFQLGVIDYRKCVENLSKSMDEYKRVYKLRL
jgi:predicted RNase H-like nuclease (RuvC/YqgF family)